jgi:hypothetical protein
MAVLLRTVDLEAHAPELIERRSVRALRPARADPPEVAWCAFGRGETSPAPAVPAFFRLIFFGPFVGGAALGRNRTPERARDRSFDGEVGIASHRITGREALRQIAATPVALASVSRSPARIAVLA